MKQKRLYFIEKKKVAYSKWAPSSVTLEERRFREKAGRLFHDFFITSGSFKRVTFKEIESARRTLKKVLKKKSELQILFKAFVPLTKKPAEVRMGKGKGKISSYVSVIVPGQPLFRIKGVSQQNAYEAYSLLRKKVSFRILFHDFFKIWNIKHCLKNAKFN